MDLMDEELRRVLAGSVEPAAPESEFANEMRRLRARDAARPPTASELEAASRPSFRTSSPGRRTQRGGGEAVETIGSAVLGSIPAGLTGLGYLVTGQGPQKAAEAVQRVQDYLTLEPQTEGGIRAVRGIAEGLSPLGAIPQAAGEATLRATGSPLLATGAELLADPLNLLGAGAAARPAARAAAAAGRGAAKAGKATVQSLGPKAAEMAEAYMRRAGMMPEITVYHGTPDVPKIKESNYETTQEGPFYRVKPRSAQADRPKTRGVREEVRQADDASGSAGNDVPKPISDEAISSLIRDPSNFVRRAANEYSQRVTGQGYQMPDMPPSSLAKQSAIGRAFQLAADGDNAYKQAVFEAYGKRYPELVEAAGAKNYDQLLEAAYRQLAKETADQFHTLPVNMSYHRSGEGNYQSSGEMLRDVYGNRHLYVYQGGDPHDFLNAIDPKTNLNTNEMFRAVHDFYGHAVHGNPFGPKGEEIAFGAHAQMFSPLARMAMASETRGQNSFVNYTPVNAQLKQRINRLNEARYEANRRGQTADAAEIDKLLGEAWQGFQFAPQKSVLLPPEFVDTAYTGGMPGYIQPLIRPEPGTTASEMLTHFSHLPDLQMLDPTRYGTGIKGREMERLLGTQNPVMERSYAYTGDPSRVRPEPGLGRFRYGTRSEGLYDLAADPLLLRTLAAEANRTPFTAKYNKGMADPDQAFTDVERMAKEYGYEGLMNPQQGTAIMYGPTPVQPFQAGGAVKTKAQGGSVGENMSYTQAADVIANKLVGQGVDPDRAMTMALRMSDAHMKAGGAVMMNQGGSPDSFQYTAEESEASDRDMRKYLAEQEIANRLQEKEDRYRRELEGKAQESAANAALAQRFVEQSLSKGAPAATKMRRSWSGPMPNRPVVNGRKMVSAEELADFRRQFGEKMTLRDLLNADRGMGPSATNPAARGQRRAEAPAATTVRSDPYQDPSRVLEGVAASQRAIAAQPGRDAVEGAYPETALVPMRGVMQVARALLAAKPRQEPSMVVEAMRRADLDAVMAGKQPPFYREMQNLTPPGATPPPFRMPPEAPPGALVKLPDGSVRRVPDPNALRRYEPLDVYQRAREVAVDPRVRALEEYFEPTFAAGGAAKGAAGAAARAAARAEARLAAKKAAEDAAKAAPAAPSLTGALRPAVEPVRGQTSRELQALQRQQLTPQQKEVFAELRRRYPDFGQAAKFMTPQEVMKVIARPDNAAAMNRLLQTLPSAENLAAVAKAGEPKRGWYRASTQAIIDVFGLQDAPRFSALLAAMSPQTSVEMNLLNTLNTWKNWTAAGRPTDPAKIRQIMGQSVVGTKGEQSVLEAWANNATRALTADDPAKVVLSGPKVDSFYRNLADDVYRVTNDAWMASGLGVGQELFSGSPTALQLQRGDPGLSPGYMGTSARVREAGQRAGILPSEAQETTWSFFMPLYEMQRETGLSAREILQRGLLTPDRIRGTPDFSTLLGQGKYGDILRQAGYEEQLAALKPGEFSTRTADLSLPEQREVEAAAKRLEGLKTMRGAESRSRSISLPPAGQKLQSAFAVEPHEYIPGAGVRLGESMVTAPLGTREHYSSAISSLFRDPMGRDRLQRAVGLNPLPTRAGTVAFRPGGGIPYQGTVRGEATTQRMPVESQPAFASVAEVPVVRGGLDIAQKAKERLGAAAAMRGYLTGQHGSTYNVHIPREGGESFMVQVEGKAEADPMRYTYQLLDDAGYLADTGAGVNVLMNKYKPGNVPFTPQEAADMTAILGGKGFVPGVNVSDYIDYSPAWMGPEGSGAATRELMKRIEPLSKPEKAALSKETQDISGDLYDLFTRKSAKTGDEYRMDVMRALQILRDKGVPGLAAALSAGEALPSEQSGGR